MGIKTLFASAVVSLVLITSAPAYANQPFDTALSMSISPAASTIQNGTNVSLNFRITNVGQNTITPHGVLIFVIPPELNVTGINFSYPTGFCVDPQADAFDDYPDYTAHFCYSESDYYQIPQLSPGQFHSVTVSATATRSFTSNSTKILAFHHPGENEHDHEQYFQELDNLNGDLSQATTNNSVLYTYTQSSPSTQTPNSNSSNQNTTQGSSTTSNNRASSSSNNNSGSGETGLVDETNSNGDTSDQAEVASEISERLPERVVSEDQGTTAALAGGYQQILIIGGLLLTLATLVFYVLRKRYLKKLSTEKEYQKALKTKKLVFSHAEDQTSS